MTQVDERKSLLAGHSDEPSGSTANDTRWLTVASEASADPRVTYPLPQPRKPINMSRPDPHETDAFVCHLRTKADEGVKHFAGLPHYAGSTKTAIALTLLAYTAGKRDSLKPRSDQLAKISKDLNWMKYELAKRELELDDLVKKLQVDLRWANFQLAKKDDKDREIQALKAEVDVSFKSLEQRKENEALSGDGSNGVVKGAEPQKHMIAMQDSDVYHLREQLEKERTEKEYYKKLFEDHSAEDISKASSTSDEDQKKPHALEEAFHAIEQGLIAENKALRSRIEDLAEVSPITKPEKDDENGPRLYQQEAQKEIERLKSDVKKEKKLYMENTESLMEKNVALNKENDKLIAQLNQSTQVVCPEDEKRQMENRIESLKKAKELQRQVLQGQLCEAQKKLASMSQSANGQHAFVNPLDHMNTIRQMESKLANFEKRATENESRMKKEIHNLQKKLAAVGPLTRFIQERDFSDEKRLHLSWDEMTYAMRAAASGLCPQVGRVLPSGFSYIVEETLKRGSTDLVQFSKYKPGRFVLQYKFFEAVGAVVENILWETQKFPGVRNQLNNDFMSIERALRMHNT